MASLQNTFCRCIQKVRKTVKLRSKVKKSKVAAAKEGAAIGICVKSVLQTRGKTLKRFSCNAKKGYLKTQAPMKKGN